MLRSRKGEEGKEVPWRKKWRRIGKAIMRVRPRRKMGREGVRAYSRRVVRFAILGKLCRVVGQM